ncbi:MAG: polyribonucleotide nucleotidyltransferase [Myxococcaceae bacterium]
MYLKKEVKFGENTLSLETGKMAKQADGSVVLRYGDTLILVTAVSAKEKKDVDFLPLTVEYQERLYAAGRIPGSFFRREGRLTEKETLSSRQVDRSCRPLFPEGYGYETQVIASVISSDPENEGDIHGITGASAALMLSNIPFDGPIAGVRVGRVDGKLVANPTATQRAASDMDIIIAASKDAIVMVEGGAEQVSEPDMVAALEFGHRAVQPVLQMQLEMRRELGVTVRAYDKAAVADDTLKAAVRELAMDGIRSGYAISEKHARYDALSAVKKQVVGKLKERLGDGFTPATEKLAKAVVEDLKYEHMRALTVNGGRVGGRGHDQVRAITCEVGLLPRAHGSALFTRGETQALVATTLGTSDDEQRVELLSGQTFRKFMLHYNFPPFSVGETKPLRGPGRREIGHGALAERALRNMLPKSEQFPYTVRVVSDILESNGSSSMASVCGGTLALMDAGVPIQAPVAGIAMGLVKEGAKVAILSDILGDEDHLGDMDFKVCGTEKGITSIQMDIKITGLTTAIMSQALEQARRGRLHILGEMLKALDKPRPEINRYAPRITTLMIRPEFIKNVIGPGGKVIKDIIARTGCSINIEDSGRVDIASNNSEAVQQAIAMVQALTREAEVGKVYLGTVRKIAEFGAFVELFPGTDGLVHISELSDKRVKSVSDVLKEGDEVMVKVISIDRTGKIRLSRKEAMAERAEGAQTPAAAAAPGEPQAKA